jgi:hypothetical protein
MTTGAATAALVLGSLAGMTPAGATAPVSGTAVPDTRPATSRPDPSFTPAERRAAMRRRAPSVRPPPAS